MTDEQAKEYLSEIVKYGRYLDTGSYISLKTAEALYAAVKALSSLEKEKETWIPTPNAIADIPKEGWYWVTFIDGKAIWVDQICWDTYYERWNYADDDYPCDKETMSRIVAYMEVQTPEPYRKGEQK